MGARGTVVLDSYEVVLWMKEKPEAFFSFARSRQTTRSKVCTFLDQAINQQNSSPDYCCQALQDHYKSVFAQHRPERQVNNMAVHFQVPNNTEGSLTDVRFTNADIEAACLQLSEKSASGPDGVPTILLKLCRK